jgi:hypothetical protein
LGFPRSRGMTVHAIKTLSRQCLREGEENDREAQTVPKLRASPNPSDKSHSLPDVNGEVPKELKGPSSCIPYPSQSANSIMEGAIKPESKCRLSVRMSLECRSSYMEIWMGGWDMCI